MTTEQLVPEVRFKRFGGAWNKFFFDKLFPITSAARVHKNQWTEFGVPFFRSSDVVSAYNKQENTKAYISHELYEELSNKIGYIKKGDILVTGGGSIGIPYLVKNDEPLYFKDADLLWFKVNNKINSYFLYTFFATQVFRKHLKKISHVGTIAHYTIQQAKSTPIQIPKNNEEQTQIGSFFQKLEHTIELQESLLEQYEDYKKSMLQKMFPKDGQTAPEIRFGGFSGEWKENKLEDICHITMGQSPNSEFYNSDNQGLPLIQGNADLNNFKSSPKLFTSNITKTCVVGDILVSVRAPVGAIAKSEHKACIGRGIASLRFKDLSLAEVCFQFLLHNINIWKKYSQGSTFESINSSDIKSIKISIPVDTKEQALIGNFFQKLDKKIELQAKKVEQYKEFKKAMLQKMFV